MPTIKVETNVTSQTFRRRFSRTISLALHRKDININHTIVKYYELAASSVSSGPYTFDSFPYENGPVNFAFVTCAIAKKRPAIFRMELAKLITETMQPEIPPEYVFISFQRVDPADSIIGLHLAKTVEKQS
jgi:hypothetical protein